MRGTRRQGEYTRVRHGKEEDERTEQRGLKRYRNRTVEINGN